MYEILLIVSLLLNGIFILHRLAQRKKDMVGKLILIKDDVDNEVYFGLEVSCSQIMSMSDGQVVLMQIEHRNSNSGFNEGK